MIDGSVQTQPRRHMSINGPILHPTPSQPPSPPANSSTSPVTYASGKQAFSFLSESYLECFPVVSLRTVLSSTAGGSFSINHRATQSVPVVNHSRQGNHVPPLNRHGAHNFSSLNRHGSQILATSRPAATSLGPTPALSLNRHGNQLGTSGSLQRPIVHQRHGSDSDCLPPLSSPTPRLPPKPQGQGGHAAS